MKIEIPYDIGEEFYYISFDQLKKARVTSIVYNAEYDALSKETKDKIYIGGDNGYKSNIRDIFRTKEDAIKSIREAYNKSIERLEKQTI